MTDVLITSGKFANKHVSDLCRDRRYMNWIMTTWDAANATVKAIKNYIQEQKANIKAKYTSTDDPEFVKEWLAMSYEGYKVLPEDIAWVRKLLGTTSADITIGFVRVFVFRVDGEEYALKPMVVNERADVFAAFRHEIYPQIKNFKDNAFRRTDKVRCPETGTYMIQNADAHVDHHFRKKTFVQLVEEFLETEADFKDIAIENCGMFHRLKDRALAERWNEYHKQNAILRLIHSSANTNADFYLTKFKEPPFEKKEEEPKQKKLPPIPQPKIMTFDMLQ